MKDITTIFREDEDGNEVEVVVEFEYEPATEPTFDRDFGDCLPADPPSFSLIKAEAYSQNIYGTLSRTPVESLTQGEIESILIEIGPGDRQDKDQYADERFDQRRDDIMTGDYDRFEIYEGDRE